MEQEIIELARDLGDEFGDDAETIKLISRVTAVSIEEVNRILTERTELCI